MMKFTIALTATAALTLAACGSEPEGETKTASAPKSTTNTAAPSKPAPAKPAPAAPTAKTASAGDASMDQAALIKRGKIMFLRCRSCHNLTDKPKHLTGPNLHALIGRKAGALDDFAYSDAIKSSDVIWSAETLDQWIENPSKFIRGSRMVFAGLRKDADREALIAYIADATKE